MLPCAHGSRKRSTWHPPRAAALQEQALRHLWLHFTPMSGLEAERLAVIERGEGPYVVDTNGKRYLDFLSGLFTVQIGYSHGEELGQAALEQAKQLPVLHELDVRPPAGDRARRQAGRDRARGHRPQLLRLGRLRGRRGRHQAGPRVPQRRRRAHPPQGHRAQDRLPRHDLRRALADRHHGPAHAVRAADGGRPARREHEPVPLQVLRRPGRLQPEVRRRGRRDHRVRGPRDRRHGDHGAGAERGRLLHAAPAVPPARARDLRRSTACCSAPTRSSAASAASASGSARSATTTGPTS